MENENDIEEGELTSRAPTQEDFVGLCARLNELNARYTVCQKFVRKNEVTTK
jgi:hypothetical protein